MSEKTSKKSKGIVHFDLETTGTDVAKDRICQIAIIREFDGNVEEKKVLINPTVPIPKEATEVHGISDEMVANAPTFKQVSKSLYKYIKGNDLAGYNIIRFDIPLLVEEFLRAGIEVDLSDSNFIDLFVIYKQLYPRTLEACYEHYTQEKLEGAHDALNDTRASRRIMQEMLRQEDRLLACDVDALHDMATEGKSMVDFAGKFVRNESGVICFNFGKHKGQPCTEEMGFIKWMLDKDFSKDTLNWANKIHKGEAI